MSKRRHAARPLLIETAMLYVGRIQALPVRLKTSLGTFRVDVDTPNSIRLGCDQLSRYIEIRGRVVRHLSAVYARRDENEAWAVECLEVNGRPRAIRPAGKFAKFVRVIDSEFNAQFLADPRQREALEDSIQAIQLDALITTLAHAQARVEFRRRELENEVDRLPELEAAVIARAQARPSAVATLMTHEPDAGRRDYLLTVVVPTLPVVTGACRMDGN